MNILNDDIRKSLFHFEVDNPLFLWHAPNKRYVTSMFQFFLSLLFRGLILLAFQEDFMRNRMREGGRFE